ncbi:MAG TPA: STAS domain-containing protein, partial [Candidatus Binatia bacterium]
MNTQANDEIAAFFRIVKRDPDSMTFAIEGRLDSRTTGRIWHETMGTLDRAGSPPRLILDAEQLDYCDGSGIGLLLEIGRRQETAGGDFQIR